MPSSRRCWSSIDFSLPVIASVAKQSRNPSLENSLDCFVASLLAMTHG
jgi:hypothetical protein